MSMMRQLIRCHWSSRRLERYLDADPSAPLSPGEVTRLEEHLAECEKCSEALRRHRLLGRALAMWPARRPADPAAVDRLRTLVHDLAEERGA